MSNVNLKDSEWEKIQRFLKEESRVYVGEEKECRLFVEAILWIARSVGHHGVYYLRSLDVGRVSTKDLHGGNRMECGNVSLSTFLPTQI
jgi:hypothetical protein